MAMTVGEVYFIVIFLRNEKTKAGGLGLAAFLLERERGEHLLIGCSKSVQVTFPRAFCLLP